MSDCKNKSLLLYLRESEKELQMSQYFNRTQLLLGEEAMERLYKARVAIFGIGGVGGHAAEALARAGIGTIDLIDKDVVAISNINRQLVATTQTIGQYKTDVMKERILSINPEAVVNCHPIFFLPETAGQFDFHEYDYVIDAVDTVTAKLELVMQAKQANCPIISCMGAGNKLHPEYFEIADIYQTSVCPLAKVMRKELRARGIDCLKVVYSKEVPIVPDVSDEDLGKRQTPGSTSFVPSVAGLIMAGEVIRSLAKV